MVKLLIKNGDNMFGYDNEEILKLAIENQSSHFDGVVQYNYQSGKLFGCSMSTEEIENPLNPFIEIYRLPQGEMGEIDCKCWENGDCPFYFDDRFDEEFIDEYGNNRISCCIDGVLQDFDDEKEKIRESVEYQLREIISNVVSKDLDKLNKIRLKFYELFKSTVEYQQEKFNNNYEINVIDNLIDNAIDKKFILEDSKTLLSGDIDYIIGLFDKIDDISKYYTKELELAGKVKIALLDNKLDDALKLLNK